MPNLETTRLRLEPFAPKHLDGLYEMNRDPEVMRYISGRPDTLENVRASIERVQGRWERLGFSWWAFIEKATGDVIGAGCIQHLGHEEDRPLEIGWRLHRGKWGLGFASEAAQRMARFAFEDLRAPLLTAVCDPENLSSRRVMERLGMSDCGTTRAYGQELAYYELTHAAWQARAEMQ